MKTFENLRRITPIATPKFGMKQNSDIDIDKLSNDLDVLVSSQIFKNSPVADTQFRKQDLYSIRNLKSKDQNSALKTLDNTVSSLESLKNSSYVQKGKNIVTGSKNEKIDVNRSKVTQSFQFNKIHSGEQNKKHFNGFPTKKVNKLKTKQYPIILKMNRNQYQNKKLASTEAKDQLINKLIFMIAAVQNTSITTECCNSAEKLLEQFKHTLMKN